MDNASEHRIFHVPEMLEAILHNLPSRRLLLSKAVCRTWRDTIDNSNKLQKALFYIPSGEPLKNVPKSEDSAIDGLTYNPLLKKFLKELNNGQFYFERYGKASLPDTKPSTGDCWTRMLVTQPPICKLSLTFYWETGDVDDTECVGGFINNPEGIRMADVIQALEAELRKGGDACWEIFDTCSMEIDDLNIRKW